VGTWAARDVRLAVEWFRSRREAAVLIKAWRNHYNEDDSSRAACSPVSKAAREHFGREALRPSDTALASGQTELVIGMHILV
jgi:hypothetical protein